MDPRNSYAYCLAGHELSTKEKFEQAHDYYEKAIRIDSKNVRAYWGLGNLNLKTEKYRKAVDYFKMAIKINT